MKYILILALFVFTSCSGVVTSRTFSQLRNGMSQGLSMEVLGKANSVTPKNGMEMHKYTNIYGPNMAHAGCSKCGIVGRYDYYVVYKGDKIIEFGQTHHRPNPNFAVTNAFFGG